MTHTSPFVIVVVGIALAACITDLRTRRIPNVLTFGAAIAAIAVHAVSGGAVDALLSVGGWLTGVVLFMPFFALGGMGGGDVKLLAALGAWLGPRDVMWLAIYSAAAGGVWGVVVSIANGYLRTALRNVGAMLAYWTTVGIRPVPNVTLESAKSPRVAYAIPIFAGTVLTLWK